jgi:hypothetical protein
MVDGHDSQENYGAQRSYRRRSFVREDSGTASVLPSSWIIVAFWIVAICGPHCGPRWQTAGGHGHPDHGRDEKEDQVVRILPFMPLGKIPPPETPACGVRYTMFRTCCGVRVKTIASASRGTKLE